MRSYRQQDGTRRRRALLYVFAALAPAAVGVAFAGSGQFSIGNGTVASGGGIDSAGSFRVISTFGEAAVGTVSSGEFRLTSGFPATIVTIAEPSPDGDIFSDGFEGTGGGTR